MEKHENKRHSHELAHILRQYGQQCNKQYRTCAHQQKTMKAIMDCRTNALGGHTSRCDNCGSEKNAYNSCRNKHCPKCQFIKQEQWVDKLQGRLLPVRHFHLVFTLPDILHHIFYINQRYCYSALFSAAWKSVPLLIPIRLGESPGFILFSRMRLLLPAASRRLWRLSRSGRPPEAISAHLSHAWRFWQEIVSKG